MSSIIRVTDIGRPGLLVYMPQAVAQVNLDFLFKAAGPTPPRSVTGTTWTTVDSGSFAIPSRTWAYSFRDVDYLFVVQFSLRSSDGSQVQGNAIIDGMGLGGATNSTTFVTIRNAGIKKPSSTTVNWQFQLRGTTATTTAFGGSLEIYYAPVWRNNILFSTNIGANVLLRSATLPEDTGIRIDDEYVYWNTTNNLVLLNFNLLPVYKIEFVGGPWIKIEYVRVE